MLNVFSVQFCDNSRIFDGSRPLLRVAKRFHKACLAGSAALLCPRKEAAKSIVGPERVIISYAKFQAPDTQTYLDGKPR